MELRRICVGWRGSVVSCQSFVSYVYLVILQLLQTCNKSINKQNNKN